MSVKHNQYLMLGVMSAYPRDEALYEKLESYTDTAHEGIRHHDGLCALFDGMGGQYLALGRVFAKSEVHYPLGSGLVEFPEVSAAERDEVRERIRALLGVDVEPRMMLITHYR